MMILRHQSTVNINVNTMSLALYEEYIVKGPELPYNLDVFQILESSKHLEIEYSPENGVSQPHFFNFLPQLGRKDTSCGTWNVEIATRSGSNSRQPCYSKRLPTHRHGPQLSE